MKRHSGFDGYFSLFIFLFFTNQTLYSKLEEKRKKKEVTLLNNEKDVK